MESKYKKGENVIISKIRYGAPYRPNEIVRINSVYIPKNGDQTSYGVLVDGDIWEWIITDEEIKDRAKIKFNNMITY